MSLSNCITVIRIDDGEVDVASLRTICQYLHVCFSDGFRKIADSHLLTPSESNDDINDAASLFATVALHEPPAAHAANSASSASAGAAAASSDIAPPSGGA